MRRRTLATRSAPLAALGLAAALAITAGSGGRAADQSNLLAAVSRQPAATAAMTRAGYAVESGVADSTVDLSGLVRSARTRQITTVASEAGRTAFDVLSRDPTSVSFPGAGDRAVESAAIEGGALRHDASTLRLIDPTLGQESAAVLGGATRHDPSTIWFDQVGVATESEMVASGIVLHDPAISPVLDSTIRTESDVVGGGVMLHDPAAVNLSASGIQRESETVDGGVALHDDADFAISGLGPSVESAVSASGIVRHMASSMTPSISPESARSLAAVTLHDPTSLSLATSGRGLGKQESADDPSIIRHDPTSLAMSDGGPSIESETVFGGVVLHGATSAPTFTTVGPLATEADRRAAGLSLIDPRRIRLLPGGDPATETDAVLPSEVSGFGPTDEATEISPSEVVGGLKFHQMSENDQDS